MQAEVGEDRRSIPSEEFGVVLRGGIILIMGHTHFLPCFCPRRGKEHLFGAKTHYSGIHLSRRRIAQSVTSERLGGWMRGNFARNFSPKTGDSSSATSALLHRAWQKLRRNFCHPHKSHLVNNLG